MCCNKPVRTDMLDDTVWADMSSLLVDPKRIEQEYERRLAKKSDTDIDQSLEQMQRQIAKLKRGMGRITDAYRMGGLRRPSLKNGWSAPRIDWLVSGRMFRQ